MTIICGGGDELTTLLQHGRAQVSRNLFVCRAAGLIDTRSDVREVRKISSCNTARDSPAAFGLPRFLLTYDISGAPDARMFTPDLPEDSVREHV